MADEGFKARLRRAFRAWEDRHPKDVTQTALGDLVGKELLRMGYKPRSKKDTVTQQSVARWFAGTRPEHARLIALATVLGVDPGWLAYGSGEDEGQQGAIVNGNPREPRAPEAQPFTVQFMDPDRPTRPSRIKPSPKRRPGGGQSAMTG